MEELCYWIWLSQCFAYGSTMPARLLEVCPSPKSLYEMDETERRSLGFLQPRDLNALSHTSLSLAQRIEQECVRYKIRILPMNDPDYPNRLRHIYGPPVVLYALGDVSGLDDEAVITIVGTRDADEYALAATEYLADGIARAGGVIVSGCAVGVDTAAHRAAVEAGKRTIAVLACGIDVNYPAESAKLKRRILNTGGAILSEYPPGTSASPRAFPVRNRLLAGLSVGVLVTQAPLRSGALLTAGHAVDQGKELFCLPPYSIFDPAYAGVIRYLRDGATPVFSPEDILLPFYAAYSEKLDLGALSGDIASRKVILGMSSQAAAPKLPNRKKSMQHTEKKSEYHEKAQKNPETTFDELHGLVYNQLDTRPMSIDELAVACSLDAGTLFSILTDLELDGFVSPIGGGRYEKAEENA